MAGGSVLIEAAVNGGRTKAELAAVPYTPAEIAAEARRCAEAGAAVVHLHARGDDGEWTADPDRYGETVAAVRAAAPAVLVGITSLRPAGVPVAAIVGLLGALAAAPDTRPAGGRGTSRTTTRRSWRSSPPAPRTTSCRSWG